MAAQTGLSHIKLKRWLLGLSAQPQAHHKEGPAGTAQSCSLNCIADFGHYSTGDLTYAVAAQKYDVCKMYAAIQEEELVTELR